jgi:TonB family protein
MLLSGSGISRFVFSLLFAPFLATLSLAQTPQTSLAFNADQQNQVHDLVARVLQHADKADCKKSSCTILVANFANSSGSTSVFGMQLADAVSTEIASQQKAIQVVAHSGLQEFLEQERIPAKLFANEKAMCWMGKQLGASAILRGTAEEQGSLVSVEANLLSCKKDKASPVERISFSDADATLNLSPTDPYPKTLSSPSSAPVIRKAGVNGATAPACIYCPNPSYTDAGREAKFSGMVLLQVSVSAEGSVTEARVFRGVPYGLNQMAVDALREWKFRPATRGGESVPVSVMVETNFRLY